jgi:TolA-binding protein
MKTQISFPTLGFAILGVSLFVITPCTNAAAAVSESDITQCRSQARGKEKRWAATRICLNGLLAKTTEAATQADLLYQISETLEKDQAHSEARKGFLMVAERFSRDTLAPRARFRAARLLEDELNDPKGALLEMQRILRDSPQSPAAVHAAVHAEQLMDDATPPNGTSDPAGEYLLATLKLHANTPVAATLMHRLCKRWMNKPSHYAVTARMLDDLSKKSDNSYWDDALLLGAKVRASMKDGPGAVARLQRLLDSHEESILPGDSNSALLDDALLALGEVQRDVVKDRKEAGAAFELLVAKYPDSILVDDALVALRDLARAEGDTGRAAQLTKRLTELRPLSRHVAKGIHEQP